jgi:hypothetical protein
MQAVVKDWRHLSPHFRTQFRSPGFILHYFTLHYITYSTRKHAYWKQYYTLHRVFSYSETDIQDLPKRMLPF